MPAFSILISSICFVNKSLMKYRMFHYHLIKKIIKFVVSVYNLSPDTFSAQDNFLENKFSNLDQWAITLSSKDGCFQAHLLVVMVIELPFPLSYNLGTLTYDLGYFPFD